MSIHTIYATLLGAWSLCLLVSADCGPPSSGKDVQVLHFGTMTRVTFCGAWPFTIGFAEDTTTNHQDASTIVMELLNGQAEAKVYRPRVYGWKQELHFGWTERSPYEGVDSMKTVPPVEVVDIQLAPTEYGNGMEIISHEVNTKVSLAGVVLCIWVSTTTLVYGDESTCPVNWSKEISAMYKLSKRKSSLY